MKMLDSNGYMICDPFVYDNLLNDIKNGYILITYS